MQFHDFLRRLAATSVAVDLSTGSPLLLPELQEIIHSGLRNLLDDDQRELVLSSYAQLDGLDTFREEIADVVGERYQRSVSPEEVMAIPGVQVALRYVHAWLAGRKRRALYPVGLEFPGAVDTTNPTPPAVGPYQVIETGDSTWTPVIDTAAIRDWSDVGAVILSRPHSPTGRDWSVQELTTLAEEAISHDALLVLDETYAPPFAPIAAQEPTLVDAPNVLHLFSMSKLGLAGERVGAAVAHPDLVRELGRLQRSFIIQPPKVGQYLTLHLLRALRTRPDLRQRVVSIYRQRWEAGRAAIADLDVSGLRIAKWEGGLFLWLEWNGGPGDMEVTEALLAQGIAVMPGTALQVPAGHALHRHPHGLRIGLGAAPESVALAARSAASLVAVGLDRRMVSEVRP